MVCNADVLVITVATKETNAFRMFNRSAEIHQLPLKVLGMGGKWKGFGQKVILLRDELEKYRYDRNRIILFADAYDVLFLSGVQPIVDKFKSFQARILFSAEPNCAPDGSLASK